jgi:hypothetical protein
MSSAINSLTGEFESCWRVLIDIDGREENEKEIVFNAVGWDGMVSKVEAAGHTTDQIIHYTHC